MSRAWQQISVAYAERPHHQATMGRPDYLVLITIERLGAVRPSDLADGQDLSTVSRRLASLVERGWLDREPDPHDRRASRVSVSADGAAALRTERAHRAELLAAALGDWSEEDIATLTSLLDRFATDVADLRDAARTTPSPDRIAG